MCRSQLCCYILDHIYQSHQHTHQGLEKERQRDHFSFSGTTQRCPTIAADVIITIKLIAVETAASVRANGVTTNVITFISALSTLINIWIGRVGGSHYTKVYKPAGYPSVANVPTQLIMSGLSL